MAAWMAAACIVLSGTIPDGGGAVELEGVDSYRVWGPLFEGVRVVLDHRGEEFTPAYIQGISGEAFRIAGICPCAPTCSYAMETAELITLLGYEYRWLHLIDYDDRTATDLDEVVRCVREWIDAGKPVLAWNAFTLAEWDVIAGYDAGREVFTGRGSYAGTEDYAEAPFRRIADSEVCPPAGVILIGERTGGFDPADAELSAVREAVRHARTGEPSPDLYDSGEWRMLEGLACYDRWVRETAENPEAIPPLGNRYCLVVYASTRSMAAEFLREIQGRWPDASGELLAAADLFEEESERLRECMAFLYPQWETEPDWDDPEVRSRAAEILTSSRDAYRGAVERLESALPIMEAAVPEQQ
jgi:hypothetical protein